MERSGGSIPLARALAVMAVWVAILGGASSGAAAQTTTTASDGPSTTEIPTAPPPTPSPPSSTASPSTTAATSPDTVDSTSTSDPLVDEPPGETVPETDETVPAATGSYEDQEAFEPQEVLWSSVRAAERKVSEANETHGEAIERVREARRQRKALQHQRDQLTADNRGAIQDLATAEVELQERAVAAFVTDDSVATALFGSLEAADYDQVLELRARVVLLEAVLGQDRLAIESYIELRARLDRAVVAVVAELRRAERRIVAAVDVADQAKLARLRAEDELVAFRAGSAIYISGVVFPVAAPYETPLIDSFGFPRMPGTPDEHWHEGIDLFAPAGTPLLAAERGIVIRIGTGRLGGLTFWLRGESGADWYYAHLLAYAPDLEQGDLVEAGQVLGFVGNTGNAATTPSHVHLELHPGGGEPVNPYPLLKVVSDRDPVPG